MEEKQNGNKTDIFKEIRTTKDNYKPVDYLDRGIRRHIENILFFTIGFLFFPFGVIIWAYYHESRPKDAIYPLIGAMINLAVIFLNIFALFFLL